MLTSEQIEKIVIDFMLGNKPRVTGVEVDQFLEKFAKDVELAQKNGWTLELPFEIPDMSK